ncbi:MAG: hypothetical protein E4H02_08930 [Lentisphaerales bacterium]|jgi:hypothetical protein|nr:MAG: hypothetical protein E4H02_08930 [Lentisphaerales bacterium]
MNSRDKRNALKFVVLESMWGFQAALVATATVLTVLLRELGAGPRMIGSIAAIEGGSVPKLGPEMVPCLPFRDGFF